MNQINTQFVSDTDKLMRVIAQTLSSFADIVGKTLGPGGLPTLIQRFGRDTANRPIRPLITKDGVTEDMARADRKIADMEDFSKEIDNYALCRQTEVI